MRDKAGPDRTRRSLIKAAALIAGVVAGGSARAQEGYYVEDPTNPGPGPTDKPPWAGGPGCNPNGNCPGNRPCFLRGTLILTDTGYRPVDTLGEGDRVSARFASFASIERIESFTLERSGPRREWLGHSRPVTVRRGALGEDSPHRDLCLTASHAVFVDGFLMPVGQLVNGTSIVLEPAEGRDTLDFFHIALERHDLLDAEGAPCESLLDPLGESCVPMLSFGGGHGELRSRLRSAVAAVIDRRHSIDLIRDAIEERGLALVRAA